MKITIALLAAAAFVAVLAGPAQAAAFHCQNRGFSIHPWGFIDPNGGYVLPEFAYEEPLYGMLRASGGIMRDSRKSFRMVCLSDQEFAIRAPNGRYVSVEVGFTGSDYGMLRARATAIGPRQRFRFESSSGVTNSYYVGAFKSVVNNRYVTVEPGYPQTDSRYAMLRAVSNTSGSRESFYLDWDGPLVVGERWSGPCFDSIWMTEVTWMFYVPPPGTLPPGHAAMEVSFTPTTTARLAAKTPDKWAEIWEDLNDCVSIMPIATDSEESSLYKQLACHAVFGIHEELGGPTWDLESHRPDIAWNDVLNPLVNEKCNWGGGGSSSSLIGRLIFRPSLDRFLNGPFHQSHLQPTPSGWRFGQPKIEFQNSGHIVAPVRSWRLSWRVPPRGLPSFAFSSPVTRSFNDDHIGVVK